MKKHLLLILACLTSPFAGHAYNCCGGTYSIFTECFGFDSVLTFDVGGGYRKDNLSWEAFPKEAPGVEIQQEWKNVGMGIVEANAVFLACDHILLKADFDYGWFCDSGHQSLKEFYYGYLTRDITSSVKGNAYDISGGLGYQFNFNCLRTTFAPLAGYSYNQQRFKNRNYQNQFDRSEDKFHAHNSYNYRWSGPWLGFSLGFNPCRVWQFYFDYAFHWAYFRGSVKEKFYKIQPEVRLRSKQCYGNEFITGAIYNFCDGWSLGFKFNYKKFFGSNGHWQPIVHGGAEKSSLRKIRWNSWYASAVIGYDF